MIFGKDYSTAVLVPSTFSFYRSGWGAVLSSTSNVFLCTATIPCGFEGRLVRSTPVEFCVESVERIPNTCTFSHDGCGITRFAYASHIRNTQIGVVRSAYRAHKKNGSANF